jgi:hypothetical protein
MGIVLGACGLEGDEKGGDTVDIWKLLMPMERQRQ